MLNVALTHIWASSGARLVLAALITAVFALLALAVRGVNRSGALAGGAACLLLFISGGPAAFATLVTLFLLTWTATRIGFRRKLDLGVAERREGRSASQVLANLGVAAVCSLLAAVTGNSRWLLAAAGALAEAAADTVASEIGQTGGRSSLLITSWKPVPPGTDGGITLRGTVAGALAGGIVSGVAARAGMFPAQQLWVPAVAGVTGMVVDSVLGATVQRRGWINNDGVNLLGTMAAAVLAFVMLR